MANKNQETHNQIAIFEGKKVRKVLHNDEWWFSVIDVVEIRGTRWQNA